MFKIFKDKKQIANVDNLLFRGPEAEIECVQHEHVLTGQRTVLLHVFKVVEVPTVPCHRALLVSTQPIALRLLSFLGYDNNNIFGRQ